MTQTSTQELQALASTPGSQPAPAAPPARPAHIIGSEAEALEAARSFAALIAPGALARDRDRLLPWQEVEQFSQSGLWGITIPREYGGAGVSTATLTRAIALIAAADGNFGHIPQNHYYSLEVLRVGGSPAQKAFFYDRVLRGERWAMRWPRSATATSSAAPGCCATAAAGSCRGASSIARAPCSRTGFPPWSARRKRRRGTASACIWSSSRAMRPASPSPTTGMASASA